MEKWGSNGILLTYDGVVVGYMYDGEKGVERAKQIAEAMNRDAPPTSRCSWGHEHCDEL